MANVNDEDREKLLVKAFINGLSNRKVSEVNVIDLNYLNSLEQVNPKIKFIARQGSLRCANGSRLNILGYLF